MREKAGVDEIASAAGVSELVAAEVLKVAKNASGEKM